MARDLFNRPDDLDSPAYFAAAVAPNDGSDLSIVTRGLYVGVSGNVSVLMAGDGGAVTFTAVPAGAVLPIAVSRVKATGTTATSIVAIW